MKVEATTLEHSPIAALAAVLVLVVAYSALLLLSYTKIALP